MTGTDVMLFGFSMKTDCDLDELQALESLLCCACSTEAHYTTKKQLLNSYSFSREEIYPLPPPKRKKKKKEECEDLDIFFEEILKAIGRHISYFQGAQVVEVTFLKALPSHPHLHSADLHLSSQGSVSMPVVVPPYISWAHFYITTYSEIQRFVYL